MQPIKRSKLQNSFLFLFERFLSQQKALQRKSAHRVTSESLETTKKLLAKGAGTITIYTRCVGVSRALRDVFQTGLAGISASGVGERGHLHLTGATAVHFQ